MSLTYPDTPRPQPTVPEMMAIESERSAPVYARRPVHRGKLRSWMILAPVGIVTVAAIGAWSLLNPAENAAPAVTAALVSAPAAPAGGAPLVEDAAVEPGLSTEGPAAEVVPTAAPAARATPAAAPAPRPAELAAAQPVEPEAEAAAPAGPQSYEAVVAAENEGGVVSAPATEASPPLIVVEPT